MGSGCCSDSSVPPNATNALKMIVSELKYACAIAKDRQNEELTKLQKLLLGQFYKPVKSRSQNLQRSMIQNNLVYFVTAQIYMMLENHSKILQDKANFFDDQKKLVHIKASVNMLLYCALFLETEQLIQFSAQFRKTYPEYPFPSDNEMEEVLRDFKLSRKVSAAIEKDYVMGFCNKYNIGAQAINQAGHSYQYNQK